MAREVVDVAKLLANLRSARILIAGLICALIAIVCNEANSIIAQTLNPKLEIGFVILINFVGELGLAFIIGWIIAFSIENASHQRLNDAIDSRIEKFNATIEGRLDDIQRQVFRSTYKRGIPDNFINEVELLLFKPDFLRRGSRWTYRLKKVWAADINPDDDALLEMQVILAKVTMSYEVENISKVPQPFDVCINLEMPPFSWLQRYVKIERIRIDERDLTQAEIAEGLVGEDGSSDVRSFKKTVNIINPGQHVRVWGECQTIKMQDDVGALA